MKKLIGTVSFAMVMGCALALANADDVNSTNNGTSDMSNQSGIAQQQQEAGTAADTNLKSETSTTTTSTSKTAMNKSCTNDNGKVIMKGHTGYKACVKAHKKDQMGGIADDSRNKVGNQLDTNHVDNGVNDTTSSSNNQ